MFFESSLRKMCDFYCYVKQVHVHHNDRQDQKRKSFLTADCSQSPEGEWFSTAECSQSSQIWRLLLMIFLPFIQIHQNLQTSHVPGYLLFSYYIVDVSELSVLQEVASEFQGQFLFSYGVDSVAKDM